MTHLFYNSPSFANLSLSKRQQAKPAYKEETATLLFKQHPMIFQVWSYSADGWDKGTRQPHGIPMGYQLFIYAGITAATELL
jgi:hypothetical protein